MMEKSSLRKQKVWVVVAVVVAAAVAEQMGHQSLGRQRHQPYHQTKTLKQHWIALAEKHTHQKRSKKIEVAALEQA
jgi:L-amino acid N-acyltransferase YncA